MFDLNDYVQYHKYHGTYTDDDDMRRRYQMYTSRRGFVLHHRDGNPYNNRLENITVVPNHPDGPRPPMFGDNGPPIYRKTKRKSHMGMNVAPINSVVVKVYFNQATPAGAVQYSFLADKSFDKDKTPYVVVPGQAVLDLVGTDDEDDGESDKKRRKHILEQLPSGAFTIAKVAKVIDPLEDTYEGDYKWIVTGFDPFEYVEVLAVQKKRDVLTKRLKKMADEAASRRSLKELFGDNLPEEAKAMFSELEALEAAIKRNAPAVIEGKTADADTNKTK